MAIVRWRTVIVSLLALVFVTSSSVLAATEHAGGVNTSPVISVLLALAVVLLAAKVGGDLMVRLRQPEVLGELIVGIILVPCAVITQRVAVGAAPRIWRAVWF